MPARKRKNGLLFYDLESQKENKVALAAGNPCSIFREAIEEPLGLVIPPTEGSAGLRRRALVHLDLYSEIWG